MMLILSKVHTRREDTAVTKPMNFLRSKSFWYDLTPHVSAGHKMPSQNINHNATQGPNSTSTDPGWLHYWKGRTFREVLKAVLESAFAGGFSGFVLGALLTSVIGAIGNPLLGYDPGTEVFYFCWAISGLVLGVALLLSHFKPKKPKLTPEMEYSIQKMEEIRSSFVASGNAGGATKATLVVSASSTKHELERLWGRSRIAFAVGCFFLVAALGGPIASIWLVSNHQDWRYFLASMPSSAVMLAAAAVLFRLEGKLRAQYRMSLDEIAYFDRLHFAIDCAQAISEETHKETLKKIIGYLVTPGPVLAAAASSNALEEKESLDSPLDVAGKIIDASTQIADSALKATHKATKSKP